MSFPVNFYHEKKSQEEQETTSARQIVQYRGRQIMQQEIYPHLSFSNKIFLMVSRMMDMDCSRLFSVMPPAFLKMMGKIDVMSEQINPLQRQLTIEQEIAQDEEREKTQLMLQNQMNDIFYPLGIERRNQFQLAGVSSGQAFLEKQNQIAAYRKEAEKEYLKHPSHIERRKAIDVSLLHAYKSTVTEKEKEIIHQFWDYIVTCPEGAEKRAYVQARSQELFVNSMSACLDDLMEQVSVAALQEGGEFKKIPFMIKYFTEVAQKTKQQLINEREHSKDAYAQLMLDYLLLTGEGQMSFTIKAQLKMMLTEELKETLSALQAQVDCHREINQKQIESLHRSIAETKKISQDFGESEIGVETLQNLEKSLQACQAKTEVDFRKDAIKFLERFGMQNPVELRAMIPKETAFDIIMQQIMEIEEPGASQILTDQNMLSAFKFFPADMQLNLAQLENPVDYFVQHIQKQDIAKLKLLSDEPKVEEVQ